MKRSSLTSLALCVVVFSAASVQAAGQEPAADPAKGTASIAGRVVAADTGRPIRQAVMELLSWEAMRVPKRVSTDADGRFAFTGLVPARYQLSASADGYVSVEFGGVPVLTLGGRGRPIDVREGERFDKADFSLRRPGAIEGRLLDEFGDPAPDLQVQLATLEYAAGRHRLMPVPSRERPRPTDDRGHFRVPGLVPDDYYLIVLSGVFAQGAGATAGFAPAFFPGTTDLASARPIRVRLGEDVSNITLPLAPAPMAQVSGRIIDAAGQPVPQATIFLNASDRSGTPLIIPNRTAARPDGTFTLANVPAGTYTVQAFGRQVSSAGNLGASEFGWAPLVVSGTDLNGLTVRVRQGPAARGRIVLEEEDGTLKPDQVRISAGPVEFDSAPISGGPSPSEMRADWTFEVRNLSGLRVLRADVTSADWTMKRVQLEDRDVTDTPLDFREKDVDGLEVVLTKRAPSFGGRVADPDGRPVGNYSVIVFSADEARWKFPSRFIALGRPNQDGQFLIRGLPPDDYLVVALPPIRGAQWQDPEFLETLRSQATAVTLAEGEKRTIDLKLRR